jgi:hypothetical protein
VSIDILTTRQKVQANLPEEAIQIYHSLLTRNDLTALETRLANFNLGVIHHRKGDLATALEYWHNVASTPVKSDDPLREIEETELCAAANMNLGTQSPLSPVLLLPQLQDSNHCIK